MTPVTVIRGRGPVILGQPHSGVYVPPPVYAQLNDNGRALADTDWHIDRLYQGLLDRASVVRANFHRYVIDANRDPCGRSLYPGENTTGLVPAVSFDNRPIWRSPPDAAEIDSRRRQFHAQYHRALRQEIQRVRQRHGVAVVYDCHSIRSQLPFLFQGRLPDLNIGDNGGSTCAPALSAAVAGLCRRATGFSWVSNGRFRGGWTTRHYGQPSAGVHAIQMEIAQVRYLESEAAPFRYSAAKASELRGLLQQILVQIESLALGAI